MSIEELLGTHWHGISAGEAANKLETDLEYGLSEKTVLRRREFFGLNKLPEEKPESKIIILAKQFKSPLVFILVIAGFTTLVFREYTDSVVIFVTVLINTIIGFVQENRATNALMKLKQILHHTATVIRERQEMQIPQEEIVPGDIIVLEPGDKVPADARLFSSWNLQVNEAVLTGEWIAAAKRNIVLNEKTPLADRDNMAFMGSVVEGGSGKAIVTATGIQTELGRIGTLINNIKEVQTPYQQKLTRFSWTIGALVFGLAFLIFIEGMITGAGIVEMFELAVAIAVSAIPEGLPITMTIVLAFGMQRILKQKGLVRNLPAAETLGSTNIIATDKTLTLTEGKMQVEEITPLRLVDKDEILVAASLANESYVENPHEMLAKQILRGRPTDRALMQAGITAGLSKIELEKRLPLITRIPFDAATKYVASFHQSIDEIKLYVSGAPEVLLELSELSHDERREAKDILAKLTGRGLRVVCCGSKVIPQEKLKGKSTQERDNFLKTEIAYLQFVGFIALKDPIRKGVKEAIETAKIAGIKTIIVTGDHVLTARAVAKEVGLLAGPDNVMEGKHLDTLQDSELAKVLTRINVFARVEPAHKLRIIQAWQNFGAVIAMTGDGVNDAPALKRADIGLALGSGTDVAKDSADLVLLGDKFSIIPAAIKEGRVILDNIRKIITYMVSGSFTETILIGTALLFGAPFLPITALQILWINLVEGTLPSIALTTEKAEKDVMTRRPPKHNASLLTGEMRTIIFVITTITDLFLLLLFYWLLNANLGYDQQHIQTIIFVGLGIGSLLYAFSCRSLRRNIWEYNPFSNMWLNASVLAGFAMLFAVIYIPPLARVFEVKPLNFFDWGLLFALGILNVVLIEFGKWLFIQRDKKKSASTEM